MATAHSGQSGSKYDVLTRRGLSSQARAFGDAVIEQRQAIHSAAAQIAHETESAATGSATARLEKLLEQRGALVASASAAAASSSSGRATPPKPDQSLVVSAAVRARPEAIAAADEPACDETAGKTALAPSQMTLDKEHQQILQALFSFLDSNGDGLLDGRETRVLLAAMGLPPTMGFMEVIYSACDNDSRLVGLEQFREAIEKHTVQNPVCLDAIQDLMGFFDGRVDDVASPEKRPAPGFLSTLGLRRLLVDFPTVFGTQLSPMDYELLMEAFDIPEGEVVDGPEFVKALTSGFLAVQPVTDDRTVGKTLFSTTFGRTSSQTEAEAAARAANTAGHAAVAFRSYGRSHTPPFVLDA
jgi:hypothetical protein